MGDNQYTPSELELITAWVDQRRHLLEYNGEPAEGVVVRAQQAQRTIAQIRAEAKAEALTELADQMRDKFTAIWVRRKAREILQGPTQYGGVFGLDQKKEASNADQDL